jgi:hypothetical protein
VISLPQNIDRAIRFSWSQSAALVEVRGFHVFGSAAGGRGGGGGGPRDGGVPGGGGDRYMWEVRGRS